MSPKLEARPPPTYHTPYTGETEPWGGRILLPVFPAPERDDGPGQPAMVSVLTYNVLAKSNAFSVPSCAPAIISWARRREMLLKEIFSVRADLMCLQDIEEFEEWWRPQLSSAGYDSMYKQRTRKSGFYREGVAIAWKRDLFQPFRTEEMELNRLHEDEEDGVLAARASVCDNVAVMVLLQPWQDSTHSSGLCVACTQLHHGPGVHSDRVRALQARGLTRTLEAFNADFQLPTILCGTMNCLPSSAVYEILCRGLRPHDPGPPAPPGKPTVEVLSTSAVRLWWSPPQPNLEAKDPPVTEHRILWCAGGSRFLGFGENLSAAEGECVVYDLETTASGNKRSVLNPLRSFVVTGLSSGVAYEFRVACTNALGEGPQGPPSDPVRMPKLKGNEPEDRVLLGVESIKRVRARESADSVRRAEEMKADLRSYNVRKLIKVDGLANLSLEARHPLASVSGSTPRYADGALNPAQANFRTDPGCVVPETAAGILATAKVEGSPGGGDGGGGSGLSGANGGGGGGSGGMLPHVSGPSVFGLNGVDHNARGGGVDSGSSGSRGGSCRGGAGIAPPGQRREDATAAASGPRAAPASCGDIDIGMPGMSAAGGGKANAAGPEHGRGRGSRGREPPIPADPSCQRASQLPGVAGVPRAQPGGAANGRGDGDADGGGDGGANPPHANDDYSETVFLMKKLGVTGARSGQQEHALSLRSAYMTYGPGGEPPLTTSSEEFTGTVDYIFCSGERLAPARVLSLPELDELVGFDIQAETLAPEAGPAAAAAGSGKPPEWADDPTAAGEAEEAFAGEWAPYLSENPGREHHWLPNAVFPSSHLMLLADLRFLGSKCASQWH